MKKRQSVFNLQIALERIIGDLLITRHPHPTMQQNFLLRLIEPIRSKHQNQSSARPTDCRNENTERFPLCWVKPTCAQPHGRWIIRAAAAAAVSNARDKIQGSPGRSYLPGSSVPSEETKARPINTLETETGAILCFAWPGSARIVERSGDR